MKEPEQMQFSIEEITNELGLKDLTAIQLKRQIKQLTKEVERLQNELKNGVKNE